MRCVTLCVVAVVAGSAAHAATCVSAASGPHWTAVTVDGTSTGALKGDGTGWLHEVRTNVKATFDGSALRPWVWADVCKAASDNGGRDRWCGSKPPGSWQRVRYELDRLADCRGGSNDDTPEQVSGSSPYDSDCANVFVADDFGGQLNCAVPEGGRFLVAMNALGCPSNPTHKGFRFELTSEDDAIRITGVTTQAEKSAITGCSLPSGKTEVSFGGSTRDDDRVTPDPSITVQTHTGRNVDGGSADSLPRLQIEIASVEDDVTTLDIRHTEAFEERTRVGEWRGCARQGVQSTDAVQEGSKCHLRFAPGLSTHLSTQWSDPAGNGKAVALGRRGAGTVDQVCEVGRSDAKITGVLSPWIDDKGTLDLSDDEIVQPEFRPNEGTPLIPQPGDEHKCSFRNDIDMIANGWGLGDPWVEGYYFESYGTSMVPVNGDVTIHWSKGHRYFNRDGGVSWVAADGTTGTTRLQIARTVTVGPCSAGAYTFTIPATARAGHVQVSKATGPATQVSAGDTVEYSCD